MKLDRYVVVVEIDASSEDRAWRLFDACKAFTSRSDVYFVQDDGSRLLCVRSMREAVLYAASPVDLAQQISQIEREMHPLEAQFRVLDESHQ